MFLFGHVGITAGAAKIIDAAFPSEDRTGERKSFRQKAASLVSRFRSGEGTVDYRMVMIGSMLPDIIDKPMFLLLGDTVYFSGRGFTHSLLINLLLLAGGLISRKSWLMALWFGSLMHLVLDRIWGMPGTLFWPFLGWFDPAPSGDWVAEMWGYLIHEPSVFIPESIGVLILAYLGFRVIRNRGIMGFVRQGRIG